MSSMPSKAGAVTGEWGFLYLSCVNSGVLYIGLPDVVDAASIRYISDT